jgi:hypothetical protein
MHHTDSLWVHRTIRQERCVVPYWYSGRHGTVSEPSPYRGSNRINELHLQGMHLVVDTMGGSVDEACGRYLSLCSS